MRRVVLLGCIASMLGLCMTGCGRLMDWTKCQFNQGCELPTNICCVQEYMRSVNVYNQFDTTGIFEVLWLAPVVREATVALHALKTGMSPAEIAKENAREFREAEQYIDFYILAFQPRSMGHMFEGGTNAQWSLSLILNGAQYQPQSIKHIYREDVDLIWKYLLGARINSHRKVYRVRFAARDKLGKPLMRSDTTEMTMCLRRFEQQAGLAWQLCGPNQLSDEQRCVPGCNKSGCEQCGACAECLADNVCGIKKDGI